VAYIFTYILLDDENQPVKHRKVNMEFKLIHFPGIYVPDYIFYENIKWDQSKTYFAYGLVNLEFSE
jgi:hypothetical protein